MKIQLFVIIGIDASRAFIKQRTGVEEYSYQVIKNLRDKLDDHQTILYIRKNQEVDFDLPENWRVKIIKWPYLWTQIGLSLEMLFYPVDVLFVPSHVAPIIHPKNTVVAIHGLEYEIMPEAYSFWGKLYMRFSVKNSCRWANKIISVSGSTKKDLMRLYKVPEKKIEVVYEGCDKNQKSKIKNQNDKSKFKIVYKYLLFIGRLEKRKNILGIIDAFEILKERYKVPHKLMLAGKFGYGEEEIREEIKNSNCAGDIILTGFINDEKKWKLMADADIFIFPSFYEGFGIPILEAQSFGVPVIAGNNSSMPEVAPNLSALLVDPKNAEEIADAAHKLISDEDFREDTVKRGRENAKRFSWEKCAEEIGKILKRV